MRCLAQLPRLAVFSVAAVLWLFVAWSAQAAELVMFESATCSWCERWHEEIGPIYPQTAQAECAPLRRVEVHEPRPPDLDHLGGITHTPTFVLLDDGREIGRIVGYPGDDFFWALLDSQLAKLPSGCPGA